MKHMADFISQFKYLRIQGQEVYENTMYAAGVFSMCWSLVQNDVMEKEDADLFKEIDAWFAQILPFPPQCKGQEKVVCFFKTENTKEMMKMIRLALWLLDRYHHPYSLVFTNSLPGEIVYEDQYQVAVKVSGEIDVRPLPDNWSPKE